MIPPPPNTAAGTSASGPTTTPATGPSPSRAAPTRRRTMRRKRSLSTPCSVRARRSFRPTRRRARRRTPRWRRRRNEETTARPSSRGRFLRNIIRSAWRLLLFYLFGYALEFITRERAIRDPEPRIMSDTPEDKNEMVPTPKAPSQPAKGPGENEETAHLDDAVIGRAFRRSMLAAAVIAVVAGGVIWFVNRKPAPKETKVTPITAPSVASRVEREIPGVRFTDVTVAAGVPAASTKPGLCAKLPAATTR